MTSKYQSRRPTQVAVSRCRQCDREPTEANPLSSRLLCHECAVENMSETGLQIRHRRGPRYEQWRQGSLDYLKRLARS